MLRTYDSKIDVKAELYDIKSLIPSRYNKEKAAYCKTKKNIGLNLCSVFNPFNNQINCFDFKKKYCYRSKENGRKPLTYCIVRTLD